MRSRASAIEGAGSIGNHKYFEAGFNGVQNGEGHDFGDDTGNDQLLLAGGLDGVNEVFVVPGVDLTRAGDIRRIVP